MGLFKIVFVINCMLQNYEITLFNYEKGLKSTLGKDEKQDFGNVESKNAYCNFKWNKFLA